MFGFFYSRVLKNKMSFKIFIILFISVFFLVKPLEAAPKVGLHQDLTYYGDSYWWNNVAKIADDIGAQISRNSITWSSIEMNQPVSGVHTYNWISSDGAIDALVEKGIEPYRNSAYIF